MPLVIDSLIRSESHMSKTEFLLALEEDFERVKRQFYGTGNKQVPYFYLPMRGLPERADLGMSRAGLRVSK